MCIKNKMKKLITIMLGMLLLALPIVSSLEYGTIYTQEELDELDFDNEIYHGHYVNNSLRWTDEGLALDFEFLYIAPLGDETYRVDWINTTYGQNNHPITWKYEYFGVCRDRPKWWCVIVMRLWYLKQADNFKNLIIAAAKQFQSAPYDFGEGDFEW